MTGAQHFNTKTVASMPESSGSQVPYWTPVRVVFWLTTIGILASVAAWWVWALTHPYSHNSDRAYCVMNQRNLQQAVRSYQQAHDLSPGDPLDWSALIGPGHYFEQKPACPTHGESAYTFSSVIPETGTLAAPCADPGHRPTDTSRW